MNKQRLSEALAEYKRTLDVKRFYDFEDMKVEAVHALAAAARLVERLLPGVCEHGKSEPHTVETTPYTLTHGYLECDGRVWDEGIVEAVAKAISLQLTGDRDSQFAAPSIARAVLSALVELLTEKVET